jgi:hypothetical protein
MLESYQLAHDQKKAARILEQADQQLLQRVKVVSRGRLATDEAGRLLMEAERQRILEVNARSLTEQARRKVERIERRRFAMIQRAASVRGKNDDEAWPSRPPTNNE